MRSWPGHGVRFYWHGSCTWFREKAILDEDNKRARQPSYMWTDSLLCGHACKPQQNVNDVTTQASASDVHQIAPVSIADVVNMRTVITVAGISQTRDRAAGGIFRHQRQQSRDSANWLHGRSTTTDKLQRSCHLAHMQCQSVGHGVAVPPGVS